MKKIFLYLFFLLFHSVNSVSANQIDSVFTEKWNGTAYENFSMRYNEYNNDGQLESVEQKVWNTTTTIWDNSALYNYTYNNAGLISTVVIYIANASAWDNYSRYSLSYSAYDKIETELTETWNGSSWVNSSLLTYTYDANQYLIVKLEQTWNVGSSSWDNTRRITYSNNGSGYAITAVDETWNSGTSSWNKVYDITYTYDGSNRMTSYVYEIWFLGSWSGSLRQLYTYDVDGNLINERSSNSSGGGIWNDTYNYIYSYNVEGDQSRYVEEYWNSTAWVNLYDYKYTYYYSTTSLSPTIASGSILKIYPNPVVDYLTIDFPDLTTEQRVRVYDEKGTKINETITHEPSLKINFASLPSGIYSVETSGGNVYKIVK